MPHVHIDDSASRNLVPADPDKCICVLSLRFTVDDAVDVAIQSTNTNEGDGVMHFEKGGGINAYEGVDGLYTLSKGQGLELTLSDSVHIGGGLNYVKR